MKTKLLLTGLCFVICLGGASCNDGNSKTSDGPPLSTKLQEPVAVPHVRIVSDAAGRKYYSEARYSNNTLATPDAANNLK